MHVNFTRVNVKVERGSTFTFRRDLPYTASMLFTGLKFTWVRTRAPCLLTRHDMFSMHASWGTLEEGVEGLQ